MLDTRTTGLPDCRPLLADPEDLTVVFQPVVDLTAGTLAGYEALARFPGTAVPGVWFAAAAEMGLGAQLQALAIRRAFQSLPDLPPGAFLSVGVNRHLLGSAAVTAALATAPALDRVVVELRAHGPVEDPAGLRHQTDVLRGRGARIAVDGAGAGWSGLEDLVGLRPALVKLGRSPVSGAGTDPVGAALAELLGTFCSRIGAALVADGVGIAAELAASVRLGAPLGQGWLLGRPTPGLAPLDPAVTDLVRGQVARRQLTDGVAGLLRPVRQHEQHGDAAGPPPYVVLDRTGAPVDLVLADPRTGLPYRAPVSLRVPSTADVAETLQRALVRPPVHRFDPVVCTAGNGEVLGLLRVEDLASAALSR